MTGYFEFGGLDVSKGLAWPVSIFPSMDYEGTPAYHCGVLELGYLPKCTWLRGEHKKLCKEQTRCFESIEGAVGKTVGQIGE